MSFVPGNALTELGYASLPLYRCRSGRCLQWTHRMATCPTWGGCFIPPIFRRASTSFGVAAKASMMERRMHKCGDSHSASLGEAKRRPGAEYGDGEDEEEDVGTMIEEEDDDISLALGCFVRCCCDASKR